MDGQPSTSNRRAVISSVVAAGVLCLGWLLPSAYSDGDQDAGTPGVIPVEQPRGGFDQDQ
jgi:hypothetical protein